MNGQAKFNLNFNEKLAEVISKKINYYTKRNDIDYLKMKYGIEVFLINLTKIVIVFILSFIFSTFLETLIIFAAFAFVRKTSFGLHSKSTFICTVVSIFMFNVTPLLVQHLYINKYIIILTMVILSILLVKYSPAETEGHPILNKDKLKKTTLVKCIILILITLIIPSIYYKILLTCSLFFQMVSVLPLTYKLLGRRYMNE